MDFDRFCRFPILLLIALWSCDAERDEGRGVPSSEARALVQQGMTLFEAGDRARARAAFERAIKADSTLAEAHFRLGFMCEMADSLAAAARAYATAARLEPRMIVAHYNLALMLAKQGFYHEAVEEFEKTLALNPVAQDTAMAALTHFNLGALYSSQGRDQAAIEAQHQALALVPNFPLAYNELGQIYLNQGRLEEAEEVLRRAVAQQEDLAAAHYNLMTVYMRMQRPDAGARHRALFEKYREQESTHWQRFSRGR